MQQNYNVKSNEVGERLDLWICRKFPQLSRRQVKTLLDGGRVRINSRRVVIAGWQLEEGDEVQVSIPADLAERAEREEGGGRPSPASQRAPASRRAAHEGHPVVRESIERHLERRRVKPRRSQQEPAPDKGRGRIKVYYEDRDLIIVEKPAGILSLPVNEEEGKRPDAAESLLGLVRNYLKRRHGKNKQSFIAPLHRLDTETSGIMVFALSKMGQRLSMQFREHKIQRTYTALVYGRLEKEQGVIERDLEKGEFGAGKKVREVPRGEGMRAITEWRVKERYADATLIDISVRTGRTHQIRVHLAAEGFPILGDMLYGAEFFKGHTLALDEADKHLGFRRHALHASAIGIKHPANGKKLHYRSPLPEDMKAVVDALRTA